MPASLARRDDEEVVKVDRLGLAFEPQPHACACLWRGLDLDEPSSIGYTLRAMTAGLWAFLNAGDLETTLLEAIRAGGDTDTNGAVAGAVLGAKFGASAIPERWIERLPDPDGLTTLAQVGAGSVLP